MNGAIRGRDIYSTFPVSWVSHARDWGKGILLPQYGVEQHGATLA